MRKISARRGSALLVVLGMLAFMTVSAIAFAAYMRRARLPSNYLRRATSSRELVKAALARAIDDIDHAVNDNPHPGLGEQACTRANTNCNGWVGRVFMNADMSRAGKSGDVPNGAVDPSNTVSVLSLEGLAYVPAPLMGEARYYGRRTPTAQWQSFDFDAGRYAYLALDVSDYLDVNRLFAGEPRSSAANTRITLSYLFDKVEEGEDWDKLLKGAAQARKVDGDLNITFDANLPPLTSVADLSLALGTNSCGPFKYGPFKSWFYEYLQGNGQLTVDKQDSKWNPLLMPLVTDGWFPTNDIHKADDAYAGAWNGNAQSFDFAAGDIPNSLDSLLGDYNRSIWNSYLGLVGFAALCDYLDPDRVPTSLAIPTVERAPMICGFQMMPMSGKMNLSRDPVDDKQVVLRLPEGDPAPATPPTKATDTRKVTATITYRLAMDQLLQTPGGAKAVAAFPFAHKDERDATGWTMDGRFAFFLTDGVPSLRTGNAGGVLRLDKDIPDSQLTADGVMSMKMNDTQVSFSAPTAGDPLQGTVNDQATLNFSGAQVAEALSQIAFLTVMYTWTQKAESTGRPMLGQPETYKWVPEFTDPSVKDDISKCAITLGLPILNADGSVAHKRSTVWTGSLPLGKLQLNAAVWLRVLDKDGNVVDMVPACVDDDKIQNPNMAGSDEHTGDLRAAFGQPYPLMLLDTAGSNAGMAKMPLSSLAELNKFCSEGVDVSVADSAYFVADPRYNYAPENWFQSERNSCTREDWIKENGGAFGNSGNDIFFATSDAGYLQSPYELANLPRVTKLGPNNGIRGVLEIPDGETRTSLPKKSRLDATCHEGRFWKNYEPMLNDPDNPESKVNLEADFPFHASYQGQKVNPYSDNLEVLLGVFANTPLDWKRAASTNVSDKVSECAADYFGDVSGFNAKYAWSEANSQEPAAQISRAELKKFADKFRGQVLTNCIYNASKSWDRVLADLMNNKDPANPAIQDDDSDKQDYKDPAKLGGIDLGNARLYKADREFLYGFWRECFAVRQQLFLVFVRAEPLMMGGEAVGATPPQLGGRAVALVWRDPNPVGNTGTDCPGYPHRTRVLFYKNLE